MAKGEDNKQESNESYAVVRIDGRSQRVKEGDQLRVQHLEGASGDNVPEEVTFSEVLLYKGAGSDAPTIGAPIVKGASVKAAVLKKDIGKKLITFKRKRRQGFLKKKGSRARYYEVQVTGISGA